MAARDLSQPTDHGFLGTPHSPIWSVSPATHLRIGGGWNRELSDKCHRMQWLHLWSYIYAYIGYNKLWYWPYLCHTQKKWQGKKTQDVKVTSSFISSHHLKTCSAPLALVHASDPISSPIHTLLLGWDCILMCHQPSHSIWFCQPTACLVRTPSSIRFSYFLWN